MSDHICHVDCLLITVEGGRRQHRMYPADPTPHAGRYQHTANLGMTRREYRATGQDESREVRVWNERRRQALWSPERGGMPRREAASLPLDVANLSHWVRTNTRRILVR